MTKVVVVVVVVVVVGRHRRTRLSINAGIPSSSVARFNPPFVPFFHGVASKLITKMLGVHTTRRGGVTLVK